MAHTQELSIRKHRSTTVAPKQRRAVVNSGSCDACDGANDRSVEAPMGMRGLSTEARQSESPHPLDAILGMFENNPIGAELDAAIARNRREIDAE